MEDNNIVTDTVKAEKVEEKSERTWSRDEVNKMIATEKAKARAEAIEEYKKQVQAEETEAKRLAGMKEAERLASMKENERQAELLKKANDRAELAESKLNAYELKEQTIADNTDVPVELINLIDFKIYNTAEKVQEKLDTIKAVYKKSVEDGLNESFREKTPKTVVGSTTTSKKISRESY